MKKSIASGWPSNFRKKDLAFLADEQPKNAMTKPVISFRLETDLLEVLTKQAQKENRSLNNLVETVLKEYAKKLKK